MSGFRLVAHRYQERITSEHTVESDSNIVHPSEVDGICHIYPLSRICNRASLGQRGVLGRSIDGIFASLPRRDQTIAGTARRHSAPMTLLTLNVLFGKRRGHKSDGVLKVTQHHSVPDRVSADRLRGAACYRFDYFGLAEKNSRQPLSSLIIQELYTRNTIR